MYLIGVMRAAASMTALVISRASVPLHFPLPIVLQIGRLSIDFYFIRLKRQPHEQAVNRREVRVTPNSCLLYHLLLPVLLHKLLSPL